ncbi:MAG TPA: vitamin K epoxide reductase family protein [Terriglobia bacterium]|nr:vitamin K epoxide reductase family protein [Terriglobia bacterium]
MSQPIHENMYQGSAAWLPVIVLAVGGLTDALYFTFAYYGRIRKARWVPEVLCAREGSSCVTVVQTPYARVFGVPNSVLGILYYVAVIVWAAEYPGSALGQAFFAIFTDTLIAMAADSVMLAGYLIYALRRKLGVDCPFCYTAHAINAALLVLLIVARW